MPLDRSLLPLSKNADHHSQKKKKEKKKLNRSVTRCIWRYSLTSSLLRDIYTTNGFVKLRSFRELLFQFVISGLIPVSLLQSESGFEIGTQLKDCRKWTFSVLTSIVYEPSRWKISSWKPISIKHKDQRTQSTAHRPAAQKSAPTSSTKATRSSFARGTRRSSSRRRASLPRPSRHRQRYSSPFAGPRSNQRGRTEPI